MSETIIDRVDADVLHITLNDPATGNAMTNEMSVRLTDLLDGAEARARLVVLRAEGPDFCLGRNVSGRKQKGLPEALALRRANDVVFRCYGAFRKTPVPIIAAVHGRAHGFGCALAAAADITIASEDATFELPEFGHNKMPTMALSALLGRVQPKAMMYMAYSTTPFDAHRALAYGVVSDVVAATSLESAVERICATLLHGPQPAVLAIKEFARNAPEMTFDHAIEYARALHAMVNSSSEMRRWDTEETRDGK